MDFSNGSTISIQIFFIILFMVCLFWAMKSKNNSSQLNKFPMVKYFAIFMYAIFIIALASMHLEQKSSNKSSNDFALVLLISNVLIIFILMYFAYQEKHRIYSTNTIRKTLNIGKKSVNLPPLINYS